MTTSLPLGPPLTILTFSSPSVTSNSAIPDSSTRSISFFSFRKSMQASFRFGRVLRVARGSARRVLSTSQGQPPSCTLKSGLSARLLQHELQREVITAAAKPADRADRKVGKVRMTPEWLPGIDVRQMHLDEGDLYRGEGVAKRHAGVGQPSRIDDNPRNALLLCPLNAFDQGPFVVALENLKGCPFAPRHTA